MCFIRVSDYQCSLKYLNDENFDSKIFIIDIYIEVPKPGNLAIIAPNSRIQDNYKNNNEINPYQSVSA